MNWIVVADSNTAVFKDAGEILCRHKMRVTGMKSGQALTEFLRENRPDLILLGSVLWELGGFDAVSAIRRMTAHGDEIPVLLMLDPEDRDLESPDDDEILEFLPE